MEPRHRLRLAIAVFGAAALVYLPSLWNGFAYDDVPVVQLDARMHTLAGALGSFARPYWAGRGAELGIYRPLTSLSLGVDWLVSGGHAAWFHAGNVLWHAATSVLVFLLLAEFFAPAAALLGGLLFAVHPVHAEAVANVVGRAEPMSAVFFLAAMLLWLRAGARLPARRVAAVAALYALAMLSKESAATLPAILVLVDATRGEWSARAGGLRAYLRARGPALLTLAAILAAATAIRLGIVGHISPTAYDPTLDVAGGGPERVPTALQAWPVYLRLLVFPRTLLADYGPRIMMPAFGWTPAAAAGLALLAGLVLGGLVALRRGRPVAALGLLWFPVTILPVSNLLFPTGILVAERTLYVPSVALSIAVAALAAAVMARAHAAEPAPEDREPGGSGHGGGTERRLAGSEPRRHSTAGEIASSPRPRVAASPRRAVAALAVLALLAVLAMRTIVRERDWASTDTIFAALMRDRPDSFRAHWIYGRRAAMLGDAAGAHEHYAEAIRLWPYRRGLLLEAGVAALRQGRVEYAAAIARVAAARWPDDADVRAFAAAALRTP